MVYFYACNLILLEKFDKAETLLKGHLSTSSTNKTCKIVPANFLKLLGYCKWQSLTYCNIIDGQSLKDDLDLIKDAIETFEDLGVSHGVASCALIEANLICSIHGVNDDELT